VNDNQQQKTNKDDFPDEVTKPKSNFKAMYEKERQRSANNFNEDNIQETRIISSNNKEIYKQEKERQRSANNFKEDNIQEIKLISSNNQEFNEKEGQRSANIFNEDNIQETGIISSNNQDFNEKERQRSANYLKEDKILETRLISSNNQEFYEKERQRSANNLKEDNSQETRLIPSNYKEFYENEKERQRSANNLKEENIQETRIISSNYKEIYEKERQRSENNLNEDNIQETILISSNYKEIYEKERQRSENNLNEDNIQETILISSNYKEIYEKERQRSENNLKEGNIQETTRLIPSNYKEIYENEIEKDREKVKSDNLKIYKEQATSNEDNQPLPSLNLNEFRAKEKQRNINLNNFLNTEKTLDQIQENLKQVRNMVDIAESVDRSSTRKSNEKGMIGSLMKSETFKSNQDTIEIDSNLNHIKILNTGENEQKTYSDIMNSITSEPVEINLTHRSKNRNSIPKNLAKFTTGEKPSNREMPQTEVKSTKKYSVIYDPDKMKDLNIITYGNKYEGYKINEEKSDKQTAKPIETINDKLKIKFNAVKEKIINATNSIYSLTIESNERVHKSSSLPKPKICDDSYRNKYIEKSNDVPINYKYIKNNTRKKKIDNTLPNFTKYSHTATREAEDLDDICVNYKNSNAVPKQYALLQKQLGYNKYQDIKRISNIENKKDIVYNIADSNTINQLINSVKKAYKDISTIKNTSKSRNNKLINSENKTHSNYRTKSEDDSHCRNSFRGIDENHLFQLLEEIRSRSEHIENHFKDREVKLQKEIDEIKCKLDFYENDGLNQELVNLRYKLAFFINDYKKRSKIINLENCKSCESVNDQRIDMNDNKSLMDEINNLDNRMNLKNDDYQYESHFSKKYSVDKLKSYINMLKDFGLGYHMFYDEPGLDMKDFQDDVCECRTNSDIYNCKIL
jgi:hypothetical protein